MGVILSLAHIFIPFVCKFKRHHSSFAFFVPLIVVCPALAVVIPQPKDTLLELSLQFGLSYRFYPTMPTNQGLEAP